MQAAWCRQWLPQWRRQFNYPIAAGHSITASNRPSVPSSTVMVLPSHQRYLSSAAAVGGPNHRTGGDGGGEVASPKPRASTGWGHRRRSRRLEKNDTSNQLRPAVDTARNRPNFMQSSFDEDLNLSTLENSMGNNAAAAQSNNESTSRQNNARASAMPPSSWNSNPRPSFTQNNNFGPKYIRNKPESAKMNAKINECKSIDDAVRVAYGFYLHNNLPPHIMITFWKKLSSLSGGKSWNNNFRGDNNETMEQQQQLNALFLHTMNDMEIYSPADLSYLAQSTASIAKHVNNQGRNKNYQQRMLYDIFIKNGIPFWTKLQNLSLTLMDSLRPKWLVSVAWAFATISSPLTRSGNTLEVSPFFHAVHKSFNQRRREFSSKHMGNLAWSYMACRQRMPMLLNDFSNEFVRRRKNESRQRHRSNNDTRPDILDPMTLCQWANAFGKAGQRDEELFQSIAEAVVPRLPEFDSRHFANLTYACALAEIVPRLGDQSTLFDKIADAAIPLRRTFDPQHVANILWAYAKMEHPSPEFFDALAKEAAPRLTDFSAQQLANVAWSLSKHPPPSSNAAFDRIAEDVVMTRGPSLDSFTSQGLAMLAHSFATVGHVANTDFWDRIDRAATARASELGPLECSQIAWSFATIGRPADNLFRAIESRTLSMDYVKPQGLSNIAWAFSMLGYDSRQFFDAIAQRSLSRLKEFTHQDIVMLVLAYSRIGHPYPELFERIASESVSQLSKFTALDLFNMVISYAKAGPPSKPWMKAMADEIVRRPSSSFSPQMSIGITWSYSSAGFRMPALFNYLSDECIDHCDMLQSKEVASLAWSFASIGYFHRPLLGALADSSDEKWGDFDAPSLANMAWAYATAQEDRPGLFEGITNAAICRSDEFASQGVSMLLWSCAASGNVDPRLFESFAARASESLHECNSQYLANIAWAYAVANVDSQSLFGAKFVDVVAEKIDEFDDQGLGQLHQWNIWRKAIAADAVLPPVLEDLCHDRFTHQHLVKSNLQNNVMSELMLMGINPKEEFQTQSGYHLDALVDVDGEQIGLEVDGPHHFVGRNPTGATLLKRRQVSEVDGIRVVSLPYWDLNGWENGRDPSERKKQKYLKRKLGMPLDSWT